MQIKPHHPEDFAQLRQQSHQQRDAKQRDRYRAVLLALEGQSAPAIAQTLARSRRFVQIWVYMYRDHGLEAIHPALVKRPSDRPHFLKAQRRLFEKMASGCDPSRQWEMGPRNLNALKSATGGTGTPQRCYASPRSVCSTFCKIKTYSLKALVTCNIKCYIEASQDPHIMPPLLVVEKGLA
jgi:hypothetical protein